MSDLLRLIKFSGYSLIAEKRGLTKELIEKEFKDDVVYGMNYIGMHPYDNPYQFHATSSDVITKEEATNKLISHPNVDLAVLDSYFPIDEYKENNYPFQIEEGCYYQHFKGKIIKIIAIAQHTEDANSRMVIYEDGANHKIWARPYNMFTSKVDKNKYPHARQEYRFEPLIKID